MLVSAGVDVAGLLEKARESASVPGGATRGGLSRSRAAPGAQIGITVNATSEQVGAVALAYAVHKAASPIRFPPTVALTPVRGELHRAARAALTRNGSQIVARWMGKDIKA